MKILCAVMGANLHAQNGFHQISRETWARDIKQLGDLRFFVGYGGAEAVLKEDEIRLNVPDSKDHILYKSVEIFKWALHHKYDMILKIDTDTYINIPEIIKHNYQGIDYAGAVVGRIGHTYGDTVLYSFLQGSAVWFSAKAAKLVINNAIDTMNQLLPISKEYNRVICPYPHSEDLWIGQALTPYILKDHIKVLEDNRYANGPMTFHFALDKLEISVFEWMEKLWEYRADVNEQQRIHECREELFKIPK